MFHGILSREPSHSGTARPPRSVWNRTVFAPFPEAAWLPDLVIPSFAHPLNDLPLWGADINPKMPLHELQLN
jgi:hypothetical protein